MVNAMDSAKTQTTSSTSQTPCGTATLAVGVRDLHHVYRGGHVALRGVTLDVQPGECVAVVGPNGSGKTTLFSILATRMKPQRPDGPVGDVAIYGHCPWAQAADVRRQLGVVFQNPSVDVKLTAQENLRYQARLYGIAGEDLNARIAHALQSAGLETRGGEFVERFSGGMKRRLEIAKAMLHRPALLLLDEPDAGLDPRALREVWDQLDALRQMQGTAVMMATHRMELAQRCDRVAVLHRGQLEAFGTPAALRAALPDGVLRVEVPAEAAKKQLEQITALRGHWAAGSQPRMIDGAVVAYDDDAAALAARVHQQFGAEVTRISFGRATLEDVFFSHTAHDADNAE